MESGWNRRGRLHVHAWVQVHVIGGGAVIVHKLRGLARSVSTERVGRTAWLVVPAVAALPALMLEPKWCIFYVAAAFVLLPAAFLVDGAKLWLFVLCALSSFNFTKIAYGEARAGVPDPGVVELKAIDVPILALLSIVAFRTMSRGGAGVRLGPSARRALAVGGLFVAWTAVGAIGASRPDAVLVQSAGYARLLLALAVVACACAGDAEDVRWGLAGLFLSLAGQSAIAVLQYIAGSSLGLYAHFEEDTAIGVLTRSGGTLNPTVLSEYIGLVAPVALATALAATRRWLTAVMLALFGAAASATVLTLSRGGIVSLALSTLIVVVWVGRRPDQPRSRKAMIAAATVGLAVIPAGLFSGEVLARFSDMAPEMEGEAARLTQMNQALGMIAQNPVHGVGLGLYMEAMGQYGPTLPYPVHNKFLGVAAETGIPGGVLYAVLWLLTLATFVRRALAPTGREAILYAGGMAAVVGTLVNMNTDVYSTGGAPELTLVLLAGLGLGSADGRNVG